MLAVVPGSAILMRRAGDAAGRLSNDTRWQVKQYAIIASWAGKVTTCLERLRRIHAFAYTLRRDLGLVGLIR